MEFITDRTYGDIDRVKEFEKRGWKNLSDEEKEEWKTGMKGTLNYTDLNRIQDNSLEICAEYLKEIGLNSVNVEVFTSSKNFLIAILTKGNAGQIIGREDGKVFELNYGINILSIQKNFPYFGVYDDFNSTYLFEADIGIGNYLHKFWFYGMGEYKIQEALKLTLKSSNECAAVIKRPYLIGAKDYRSHELNTGIEEINYNKINELEKSLKLSYDWIFNKKIDMPMEWDFTDTEITNKYLLASISENAIINIKIPKGFYLNIVYGLVSNGEIVSIKNNINYITDEKDIKLVSSTYEYSYQFKISNYYINEKITLTTLVNSPYIECNVAEKLKVNIDSDKYSTYVLYAYNSNKDLIKIISPCDFGMEINISEYYYIQIMVPGSGGLVDIIYELTNNSLNNFAELNPNDIEIAIEQKKG